MKCAIIIEEKKANKTTEMNPNDFLYLRVPSVGPFCRKDE